MALPAAEYAQLALPSLSTAYALEASGSDVLVGAGHTRRLVAGVALAAVKHVLFAKGLIAEPIALMERQRRLEAARVSMPGARRRPQGARERKRDKLLAATHDLSRALSDALEALAALPGSSTSAPLPLVLVFGPSVLLPRSLFVLDVRHAAAASAPEESDDADEALLHERERRRKKDEGVLERRLVRFLVEAGDEDADRPVMGIGEPLAPTKTHILLLAPASFVCPGWTPRRNVKLDWRAFESATPPSGDDPMASDAELSDASSGDARSNSRSSNTVFSDVPSTPRSSDTGNVYIDADESIEDCQVAPATSPPAECTALASPRSAPPPALPPMTPFASARHLLPSRSASESTDADDVELHRLSEALSPLKRRPPPATPHSSRRPGFFRIASASSSTPFTPRAPAHAALFGSVVKERRVVSLGDVRLSADEEMHDAGKDERMATASPPAVLEAPAHAAPIPMRASRILPRTLAADSLLARSRMCNQKSGAGATRALRSGRRAPAGGGITLDCGLGADADADMRHGSEEMLWFSCAVVLPSV